MSPNYDELERLQRLRQGGALTDEEFEREKARLLAGDAGPRAGDRTFLYLALGLVALALAIAGGILLGRESGGENVSVSANLTGAGNGSAVAAPAAPPPPALHVKSPAFLASAFRAATGADRELRREVDGQVQVTTPLRIVELPFGPALITSTEIVDGCHACTGALGVHYLRVEGDRVVAAGNWPRAVPGWGWGHPPTDWSISDRFATYPVIVAEGGFMGQGIACGGATLTELRPEGPVTSPVIATDMSNEGALTEERIAAGEKVTTLEGKFANIKRDQGFEVRVTGTESFTERYVRKGKSFAPVAETRITC